MAAAEAAGYELRMEIVRYGRMLVELGLVIGPGGNISVRAGDIMYISPAGCALDELDPEQCVAVHIPSGRPVSPEAPRPSSETPTHLACYRRRPDAMAVVHAHPPMAIALSLLGMDIRAMYPEFVIYLGEKVPNLGYLLSSTEEMGQSVAEAMSRYQAVVLQNHGTVAVGSNAKEAFIRTQIVEESARILLSVLPAGQPRYLSEREIADILQVYGPARGTNSR